VDVGRAGEAVIRRAAISAVAALAIAACGGLLEGSTNEEGGAADAGGLDAAEAGGQWTPCSTPDGYRVCNGPNQCPADGVCLCGVLDGTLSYCVTDALAAREPPGEYSPRICDEGCQDGDVCISGNGRNALGFECMPFSLGELFERSGAPERVRYADLGTWSGAALPVPADCPTVGSIRLCGPACPGRCTADEICSGRSPLHPYGMCRPVPFPERCSRAKPACPTGNRCFIYTVEPEAQAVADGFGSCLPETMCLDAATGLPGGASCL